MNRQSENGMVSIIVVMFTSLLLIIISVGFVRLMSQEETQASDNNLSQSAYDSAVSGVEDAKRVITACANGGTASAACTAILAQRCDTVQKAGIAASTTDTRVTIRSNGAPADSTQGQAYTCVKIENATDDVKHTLEEGVSKVIPLKATKDTDHIMVQWTLKSDDTPTIANPNDTDPNHLPQHDAWGADAPAMLRVQIVVPEKPDGSMEQADYDSNQVMTVLLRPTSVRGSGAMINAISLQATRAAGSQTNVTVSPSPVLCSETRFNANQYACAAVLTIPSGRQLKAGSRMAFMRVTSLYARTQLRASFEDISGNVTAQFDGVQPLVDSTGRAGDVYRRVLSRVSPDGAFTFPEYAVDTTGSLCKDFSVSDTMAISGICDPRPKK